LFLKYLRTILTDIPVDFPYAAIAKIDLCDAQSSEYLHRRQFARNGRASVRGIGMAASKGGKTQAEQRTIAHARRLRHVDRGDPPPHIFQGQPRWQVRVPEVIDDRGESSERVNACETAGFVN
jgi:hypothetical protein